MKTYIVEDNDDMRFILKRLLRKNFPQIEAFGESETAEEALVEIPHLIPISFWLIFHYLVWMESSL
jgi:response regulator RpfG family c-di-GMP phosphodiesterase